MDKRSILILVGVYIISMFVFDYVAENFFSLSYTYLVSFILTLSIFMLIKNIKIGNNVVKYTFLIFISSIIYMLSFYFLTFMTFIYLSLLLCIISYKLCIKHIESKKVLYAIIIFLQVLYLGVIFSTNFGDIHINDLFFLVSQIPFMNNLNSGIFSWIITFLIANLLLMLIFKYNKKNIDTKTLTVALIITITLICILGTYMYILTSSKVNMIEENFDNEKENLKNSKSISEISNVLSRICDEEIKVGTHSASPLYKGKIIVGFYLTLPYIADVFKITKDDSSANKKFTNAQLKLSRDTVDKFISNLPQIKNEFKSKLAEEVYLKYIPIEIIMSSIIYLISIYMLKNRSKA